MSIDKDQLRLLIANTLTQANLYSTDATELLMGTAAQESHLGTYIRQLGNGPARGIFQCEPATERDIWDNFLKYRASVKESIWMITEHKGWGPWLQWDLAYQILIARCHYLRKTGSIPSDLAGQAGYWKKHYNTYLGAGTVDEYIANYEKYCS